MKLFRNDPELDAATVRELDAIDSALEGGTVDPELAELAQLSTELRQDRPVPRELFTAELDRRVADGFPPARTPGAEQATEAGGWRRPSWLTWRGLAPVGAVAASLFVVGGAVLSSGVLSERWRLAGGWWQRRRAGSGRDRAVEDRQRPARKRHRPLPRHRRTPPLRAADERRPAPTALRSRQVERYAELTLATPPGKVEDTADGVVRVTDRYSGFVVVLGGVGRRRRHAGATFTLRIPSDQVQAALADLSELGHVRERTQSTDDITSEFVSVRSRINSLSKERAGAAEAARQRRHAGRDGGRQGPPAWRRRSARGQPRAAAKRLDNRVSFSTDHGRDRTRTRRPAPATASSRPRTRSTTPAPSSRPASACC